MILNKPEHMGHLAAQSIEKERSRVSVLSFPHSMGAVITERVGGRKLGTANGLQVQIQKKQDR